MNIPQDVLDRFRGQLRGFLSGKPCEADTVAKLIEAAQLLIAYPSQDELEAALEDCQEEDSVRVGIRVALNNFISRRNSPPQVDPLVEKIDDIVHDLALAEKIAAAVRRDDNV